MTLYTQDEAEAAILAVNDPNPCGECGKSDIVAGKQDGCGTCEAFCTVYEEVTGRTLS